MAVIRSSQSYDGVDSPGYIYHSHRGVTMYIHEEDMTDEQYITIVKHMLDDIISCIKDGFANYNKKTSIKEFQDIIDGKFDYKIGLHS